MADLCGGCVIIRCKMSDFMVNYPAWIIIDECALVARFLNFNEFGYLVDFGVVIWHLPTKICARRD